MKNFFLAMGLSLLFIGSGYGQTQIFIEAGGGGAPTDWIFINNDIANDIDKGSYWLVEANAPSDEIITATYDLSSYTYAEFTLNVASYGNGTHREAKIEISFDGGTTYTQTETSNTTTGTSYIDGGTFTLNSLTSQVVIKITNSGITGKGIRIKDLELTAFLISSDPEPSNHPSSFAATANGHSEIDLSWTDATGLQNPSGYLIKVSSTSLDAILNPTDTNAEFNDSDLSDGFAVLNIPQGSQVASFSGLDDNTQYFFKIYSYTNSGPNINYKTDGTIQSDDAKTDSFDSDLIISQYVESSSIKGIEIWNASESTIDFSAKPLVVRRYTNGSSSPTTEAIIDTGTLLVDEVLVIGGSTLSSYMSNNLPSVTFLNDVFSFNGNDALDITLDGTVQDIFGKIGTDPSTEWTGNNVSTRAQNIELIISITEGSNNGFSDPSTRFQTVDNSISGADDLRGFGLAPGELMISGDAGYRLLSSPVTVSYSSLLDPIWTQGASGADETDGNPNVFTWDNTAAGDANTNWNGVTDLTGNITAGEGFLVYVYADDDYDESDDAFPKTLSVSGTEHVVDASPTINTNGDGWTLLGNPFASTIDFDLLTTNDISGTAYVWDPNAGGSGEWKSWNGSAGDITGGLITPYQGFFVQTQSSPSSPSVVFSSGAKSTGGTFYGKTMESLSFLRMNVENGEVSNSAWIQLSNKGSAVTTRGDAHELQPLTATYAQLGFIKNDTVFDIVHLNAEEQVMVPIEFNSTEGGMFTLNVTDFHVPDAFELTFNDFEDKISLPMDDSFSYSFETVKLKKQDIPPLSMLSVNAMQFKSTEANRFGITIRPTSVNNEVIEKPKVFALEQNYPNPFNPSTTIDYSIAKPSLVTISVYNVIGRKVATLVHESKAAGRYTVSWNATGISSGMYYYRLEANGQAITQKMTLMK